jgi:hypothetical protein
MLQSILAEVKSVAGKPKPSTTSVETKKVPEEGAGSGAGMTVEAFAKMSLSEKSQLFQKNPKMYDELMKKARSEKRI